MDSFNRWQGTVRGYAVILEEEGETFTVQIVGRKSHLYHYAGDGFLFVVTPNGEERYVMEHAFLFRSVFALAADKKGAWPWDKLKETPEFMEFLAEYRNFKRRVESATEPALTREERQPYLEQLTTATKKIERRSLQHE